MRLDLDQAAFQCVEALRRLGRRVVTHRSPSRADARVRRARFSWGMNRTNIPICVGYEIFVLAGCSEKPMAAMRKAEVAMQHDRRGTDRHRVHGQSAMHWPGLATRAVVGDTPVVRRVMYAKLTRTLARRRADEFGLETATADWRSHRGS